MMGQCAAGQHAKPDGTGCIGEARLFYMEIRKGKSHVVYRDGKRLCDCQCHGTVAPAKKPKTRTRKKK